MARKTTRRRLLARALYGAAAGLIVLPSSRAAFGFAANERLNLAVFGNRYNAAHFLTAAHTHNAGITAICNPDQREVPKVLKAWADQAQKLAASGKAESEAAAEQYRRLAARQAVGVYADARRMFAERAGEIDAVVVSDYEHFHGPVCGAAMRLGKPVCSERPVGLTIDDARRLRALAAETKVPTTYRSPGTGGGAFRRAVELVEDGAIGAVREAHVWFKRGGPDRDQPPRGPRPVPDGLDWDLWLGPLAWREYHPDWTAYSHWRETSNGGLGVFGAHTSILPFVCLKLRDLWDRPAAGEPVTASAEASRVNRVSFPRWERVRWDVPARGNMPPVTITWHHGPDFAPGTRELVRGKLRQFGVADPREADALMAEAGSMLVGSEGALVGDDHSVKVTGLPREKFAELAAGGPRRLPSGKGIYGDWVDACRGGRPHVLAGFENGGPLSELLMLGNIATQFPDVPLRYDPANGRVTNHGPADEQRGYAYREGWRI